MRIQAFQHAHCEGPGIIAEWAELTGHELSITRLDLTSPTLLTGLGALVVLGGSMGVHDLEAHPWMAEEKRLLRVALDAGVPVLGVGLGAQLLAEALGAAVMAQGFREIGWFEVECEETGFGWPARFTAFHWHSDRFELPPGAKPLARSAACPLQGFVWGDRAVGLQFRLEVTRDDVAALAEFGVHELDDGRWCQSRSALVEHDTAYVEMRYLMFDLLDQLFSEAQ